MSLYSLGLKGFLASDKGLAVSFVGIFSTSIGFGVMILANGDGHKAPDKSSPPHAYALVSANEDKAVVASPEGLQDVRLGSVLPGLGTITAITEDDGKWVVSSSSGQTLTVSPRRR